MDFNQADVTAALELVEGLAFLPEERGSLIACLDLTSLNESDTTASIAHLCQKAATTRPEVAAVCVYPRFVKQVADFFKDSQIRVATVANFPEGSGQERLVRQEIERAIEDGAMEIDLVFPYQAYLNGQSAEALAFVEGCKASCSDRLLKVILETGAIKDLSLLADLTAEVVAVGADFVKTSTGKIEPGATLEAAAVILLTMKGLLPSLGRPLGFKVSGGIREPQQAAQYWQLARNIMGQDWVSPNNFRIGSSTLLDRLV